MCSRAGRRRDDLPRVLERAQGVIARPVIKLVDVVSSGVTHPTRRDVRQWLERHRRRRHLSRARSRSDRASNICILQHSTPLRKYSWCASPPDAKLLVVRVHRRRHAYTSVSSIVSRARCRPPAAPPQTRSHDRRDASEPKRCRLRDPSRACDPSQACEPLYGLRCRYFRAGAQCLRGRGNSRRASARAARVRARALDRRHSTESRHNKRVRR